MSLLKHESPDRTTETATPKWLADRVTAILDGIGDAVVVMNGQGALVFCNHAAETLLRIDPQNPLPANWTAGHELRLADGVTPCPAGQAPWELAAAGRDVPETEWLLCFGGRDRPLPARIRATPIRNGRGQPDGVVAVLRDLTEAKQAEGRRTRNRLLALAESSPDAIVIVNKVGEIVLANSAAEAIFGYARDELLGQPVEMLTPLRFREQHPQLRARFLAGPRRRTMAAAIELWGLRKGGIEFPAEISLNAIETTEGVFVCSAIRDLTERKQVEQKIRDQQAELAHIGRLSTMGELATGLAHELNQPLTAIAAFADGTALRLKQGTAHAADMIEVVDRIAADAHRAGEIVRRMRQFVRKRETEMTIVDLNALIQESFRFLDHEVARRRVSVVFDLADGLPLLRADPVEIQQVALNLVRNALDSLLRIDPADRKCLATTTVIDQDAVTLTIEDSGTGVAANLREQVFEPFYTSKKDGLGMGLAISRSIIEAHRGRILMEQSRLGGLCVRVTLPTVQETASDSP